MSESKIPKSTAYSVYCQARAVVAMGREYPTSMCNNEAVLLFAAMVGTEDANANRREGAARVPYPTEAEFNAVVAQAFDVTATTIESTGK